MVSEEPLCGYIINKSLLLLLLYCYQWEMVPQLSCEPISRRKMLRLQNGMSHSSLKYVVDQRFWREICETDDEELFRLGDRIERTIIASRAPSTVTSYLRSLKRWKLFTQQHQSISYFSAHAAYSGGSVPKISAVNKNKKEIKTIYCIQNFQSV